MSRKTKAQLIVGALNVGLYGADAIAGGETAKALQTSNLDINPIEGDEINRELDGKLQGNSPSMLVGTHVKATFDIEIAGSGTKTAPTGYGFLIQCSGYDETAGAAQVDYSRITNGSEKDGTFIIYKDGAYHKILGAYLTFTTKLSVGSLGVFSYELTGIYGGIMSGAMPQGDFSAFIKPVKVGATYTAFKLGGTEYPMLEFELNEGNEIQYDEDTVKEKIYLLDSKPSGKVVIEAPSLGTFNPFGVALSEALISFEITHGTTDGNIVKIASNQIQLGRPSYGDKDGRMTYDIPFTVIEAHTITTK